MIVVMKEHVTEAQVQRVVGILSGRGLGVHRSTGAHRIVLGIVGDLARVPLARIERSAGVQRVVRITEECVPALLPPRPDGAPPRRIAIIGMGLVGGSLAMVLRATTRHRLIACVVPRRTSSRLPSGLVDEVTSDPARAAEADVVVLATPLSEILRLIERFGPRARPGSVWTDVGSVKGLVCRAASRFLARDATFVGGHPIAGSEESGLSHARAGMFAGATWVLTPPIGADGPAALAFVRGIAKAAGARPLSMPAEEHDRVIAFTSHLPQLVASALAAAGRDVLRARRARRLAGTGFRDTTRLADSEARIWKDIVDQNSGAIGAAMEAFMEQVSPAGGLTPREVGELFRRAHDARRRLYRR